MVKTYEYKSKGVSIFLFLQKLYRNFKLKKKWYVKKASIRCVSFSSSRHFCFSKTSHNSVSSQQLSLSHLTILKTPNFRFSVSKAHLSASNRHSLITLSKDDFSSSIELSLYWYQRLIFFCFSSLSIHISWGL